MLNLDIKELCKRVVKYVLKVHVAFAAVVLPKQTRFRLPLFPRAAATFVLDLLL